MERGRDGQRAEACGEAGNLASGHRIEVEPQEQRHRDGPQEVRIALDALAHIENEPAVLHEVGGVAERDERVVTDEVEDLNVTDE